MKPSSYGTINAHVVGTLMKEAVRRAMVAIRGARFSFEARVKGVSPRGAIDLVTTADHAAQRVFVKLLREWFPTFGVVAEEDKLSVPCTEPDRDLWFSVDPLDGTKAFVRRQSHGIGTMLALICDDRVIASCVGDIMTQEVYSTRPESDEVYRISEFGVAEALRVDPERTLAEQLLQLRDRPERYSPMIRAMVTGPEPLFDGYEITGGSIGISMARLWKSEIAAEVLRPGRSEPWDLCPVAGMCDKLGFVYVELDPDTGKVRVIDPPVSARPLTLEREILVVHGSRWNELRQWAEGYSLLRVGD